MYGAFHIVRICITNNKFFGFFADMISSISQSSEDILEYFEKFDGNNDDLDIDDNKV